MTILIRSFALCGGVLLASPLAQAIVVSNYSDATNLRFGNGGSAFIGSDFDLSGVGRASDRWGTAIGENYFLSANHYRPTTGSIITFVGGNSSGSTSYSYTVGGGFRVGSTDLWLGYTTEALDPSIARYSVTTQNADALGDLGLGGQTLYMSGDQINPGVGTVQDHILGTNQAESFYEEASLQITTPGPVSLTFEPPSGFENDMIVLFENLAGDDTLPLTHESVVQGGDSGSPLFSASGNSLTLLGVGSLRLNDVPGNFIDTVGPLNSPTDPLEERNGSAYSYVGSYESELNAAIALVPAPIPEPSSALLIALSSLAFMRRQRT